MSETKIDNLVSFIIPCYNYGQYLTECLNSIKNQTLKSWECIIIDNGSTDNTKEVATTFTINDSRFKYYYTEQKGVSFARNMAVNLATAPFILPVDADDKIGASYAEKAAQILLTKPQIKVVYCNAELFGAASGNWSLPNYSLKDLLIQNSIFCTAMYRKADCVAAGGYNEEMKEGFEDWDFWIRMLKNGGEVYKLEEVLFYYRIRSASRNASLDDEKQLMLRQKIYNNHKEIYNSMFNWPELIFKNHQNTSRLQSLLNSKDYRIGKRLLAPLRAIKKLFKAG